MKLLLFLTFLNLLAGFAHAGEVRASVGYQPFGTYAVSNVETQYDTTGFRGELDYFLGDTTMSLYGDGDWDTILGFGLSYDRIQADISENATALSPNAFDANVFSLRVIPGLSWGRLRFEVPLFYNWLIENSEQNDGDEKYGFGIGGQVHYPIWDQLYFGVAYERVQYGSGKNKSTGQSGSLANDIETSSFSVLFTYMFQGGFGYTESTPTRGRRSR